MDLIDSEAVIT